MQYLAYQPFCLWNYCVKTGLFEWVCPWHDRAAVDYFRVSLHNPKLHRLHAGSLTQPHGQEIYLPLALSNDFEN